MKYQNLHIGIKLHVQIRVEIVIENIQIVKNLSRNIRKKLGESDSICSFYKGFNRATIERKCNKIL